MENKKNRVTGMSTPGKSFYFKYDPSDYRIRNNDGGLNTRNYYLEGEHLEAIYDQTFQLQDQYFRGVVVDEVVHGLHYDSSGNETGASYHHDHLRSVTSLVESLGSAQATMQYGPFGELITETGSDNGNRLHYTGRELDESGLYYYRARYYDPEVGRFLTEDPLGFEAGPNFYAYVNNNPISFNDPAGKRPVGFNFGGGGGFAPEGVGAKGSVSTIVAIDTETLEFGIFTQHEEGGVLSGQSESGGLFVNFLFGNENTTLDNLEGRSRSISGSFPITQKRSFTFGATFPTTSTKDNVQAFFEFGLSPFGINTPEVGPTITNTESAFRSNAIGDFVDGAKNLFNSISNFFTGNAQSNSGGAGGGFVIYPNKPNNNFMQQVYSK